MNTLDQLSQIELREITGYKHAVKQQEFFARLGIRTEINRLNKISLSRTAWAQWQLGGRMDNEPKLRSIRK